MNDPDNAFKISITTKVIFTTILAITIVLGLYAGYIYTSGEKELKENMTTLAESTSIKLGGHLKVPVWNLDTELIDEAVNAEMLTESLLAVVVYDENGSTPIVAKGRTIDWSIDDIKNSKKVFKGEGIYHNKSSISYNSKNIATMHIYATDKYERKKLNSAIYSLIATLIILDLIIFIVLWIALRVLLKTPLIRLAEAVTKISKGDFTIDIESFRGDEIGVVAKSAANMKVTLMMAYRRIKRYQDRSKGIDP